MKNFTPPVDEYQPTYTERKNISSTIDVNTYNQKYIETFAKQLMKLKPVFVSRTETQLVIIVKNESIIKYQFNLESNEMRVSLCTETDLNNLFQL